MGKEPSIALEFTSQSHFVRCFQLFECLIGPLLSDIERDRQRESAKGRVVDAVPIHCPHRKRWRRRWAPSAVHKWNPRSSLAGTERYSLRRRSSLSVAFQSGDPRIPAPVRYGLMKRPIRRAERGEATHHGNAEEGKRVGIRPAADAQYVLQRAEDCE
jgi:hypothetical protein